MTSLGIHWRGLLFFILPPQFSFKNSTRLKAKVVFYQGGNLLRIQASNLSSVPMLNNMSREKTSLKFLQGISIRRNFIHWSSFHFETKVYFYFAHMSAWGTGVTCTCGSQDNFLGQFSPASVSPMNSRLSVSRSACKPSTAVYEQCSPLAVSREPRVLLGYTRLHALIHLEDRKVVVKHPSKSLTFYEFRTFLEIKSKAWNFPAVWTTTLSDKISFAAVYPHRHLTVVLIDLMGKYSPRDLV